MSSNQTPLVDIRGLKEYFPIQTGAFKTTPLKAVDDVSFTINRGETLGLVGESGCGKTTVGRTILHLYKPTAGEIRYDGKLIQTKADINELRKKATMVFQDPYSSLNPRMTVSDIIGEPLDIHKMYKTKEERMERILQLMDYVGLNSEHASRYAHEFSGGQRQRIGIARALAVNPEFIVCDEPVSALDVSIQAQVINMFDELQDKLGLTYLFIAHDLLVVRHISDRIAVMYLGKMVELADAAEIYDHPMMYLKEQIFDVCGMERTGYFELDKLPEGCADNYIWCPETGDYRTNIYSVDAKGTGAGGAFVTAGDLVKFWKGLISHKLLSETMVKQMFSKKSGDGKDAEEGYYGYGVWIIDDPEGEDLVYMQGSDPGVSALTEYNPNNGMISVLLSNYGDNVWARMRKIRKDLY